MTIKLNQGKTRRVRCEARPLNDKGGYDKHMFFATFEVPSQEERVTLSKAADEGDLDLSNALRDKIRGWEKIHDADDQPLEFNDENIEIVLNDVWIFDGLRKAFTDLIFNREDLRRKN